MIDYIEDTDGRHSRFTSGRGKSVSLTNIIMISLDLALNLFLCIVTKYLLKLDVSYNDRIINQT